MKKFALAAATGSVLGLLATTQIAGPLIAQEADRNTTVYEQLDLFGDIFERIRAQYVEEVDSAKLIEAAINGMLTSLDPHSSYLSPDDADDIIASTPSGVYVAKLGGGSVNTASGDFVFGMTEAYLIEGGEITEPLREGNLIGNGPAVLAGIDAVGDDFAMGPPGTCGKDGQGVPVGDGQPTLRVKSLTIGGTAS